MVATENLAGKSGVYCAIHRDTLACYIGAATDLHKRRKTHLSKARNHPVARFHRVLKELGEDSFDFEVLELCPKEQLAERETFWASFYNSAGFMGLNSIAGATHFRFGIPSEEWRAKVKAAQANRPKISEATRQRMREAWLAGPRKMPTRLGTKHAQESRDKMRLSHLGHTLSPEHREKLRITSTGRKFSEESRAKIKAAALKRWSLTSPDERKQITANGLAVMNRSNYAD